jgi:peptidoglycan/xylan/chitin deacetylase (PgdA/CDA1 family)
MPEESPKTTICVTLDFDAVSLWMDWGARGLRSLARGDFGATTGAPRLLDMFAEYGVSATWFTPGHTADTYPGITKRIAAEGHELANHGYLHEDLTDRSPEQIRDILRRANESLESVGDKPVTGFRAPGGDLPAGLMEILVQEGFSYDSSLPGEFEIGWCPGRPLLNDDRANPPAGEIDLVELPSCMIMSDFVHFEFNFSTPSLPAGLRDPRNVEAMWRDQLDYMVEHVPGGVYNLTLHPQSIGYGHRMQALERFLGHCRELPAVRFPTCDEVAREFRAAAPGPLASALPR